MINSGHAIVTPKTPKFSNYLSESLQGPIAGSGVAHRRSGARRYPIKHRRHTEPHIPAVMTKKYRPQPWNVPQQCLHCGLLCSCRSNGAARSAQATFDPHTDNTPQQHGTIAQLPHHMGRTDQNHVSAWSHKGAIALGLHYSNPIRMWDQASLKLPMDLAYPFFEVAKSFRFDMGFLARRYP